MSERSPNNALNRYFNRGANAAERRMKRLMDYNPGYYDTSGPLPFGEMNRRCWFNIKTDLKGVRDLLDTELTHWSFENAARLTGGRWGEGPSRFNITFNKWADAILPQKPFLPEELRRSISPNDSLTVEVGKRALRTPARVMWTLSLVSAWSVGKLAEQGAKMTGGRWRKAP